jgi:tetratricopeptide (TPR) repeat protein
MDTQQPTENLPAHVRTALEPSPRGAQLRRRVIAVAGFGLLVTGFLLAIGLWELVVLLVLAAAAGAAILAGKSRIRGRSRADALRGARAAARRPVDGLRTRKTERKTEREKRSRERDRGKEAGRLNARGVELRRQGDAEGAVAAHRAALEIAQAAGDSSTEAMTLNNLGLALAHTGDERAAIDHFDASVALLREIDDAHHEGQVLANLGFLHGRSGRHEQALYCLQTALDRLEPDSRAFRHVQEQLRRAS